MVRKIYKEDEYLFVDGYNIINSWDIFNEDIKVGLEEARKKLIDILIEYRAFSGINIILVFDAHLVKGNSGTVKSYDGLKVVYTQEHETADHYIERTIDKIGRLKRVRVATSDKLEQQIVLGRGATRLSAREFKEEVFGEKEIIKKTQEDVNQKNDIKFGGLDEKTLEKLKKIKSNK